MRVVRFNDVSKEHLQEQLRKIGEESGPPEGVTATRLQILFDEAQGSCVVLQHFDSAEDMQSSEQALDAMDPADTPGTRVSVDRCELLLELSGAGARS